MSDRSKGWFESATLWINGLAVLVAVFGMLLEAATGGVLPFHPDAKLVALLGGLVNIVLRLRTDRPIRRRL